jgi:nucleotide-binding universal stress UspA family protein
MVTALHVVAPTPVVVPAPYYFGVETPPPMTLPTADRTLVSARMQQLAAEEPVAGVQVATLVTEASDVHREIVAQAERLQSSLIVMGTHGRSGFERLFLGSTTEKVLRTARCPVMTIPPSAPDAVPSGPVAFRRILCAVDFSDSSKLALDYALSLASENGAALTVAHVVEARPVYYDFAPAAEVDLDACIEEARVRLRALVPDSARSSCPVYEVAREGRSYREILALASGLYTDLIVLGVQGRGAVDLLVFGSTAHHVIREAQCAVLTLRG